MEDIVLVGPLAHPALRTALGLAGGQDLTLTGRLVGGRWAGIRAGGWPRVVDGEEPLAAVRVRATAKLERYAAVMGLAPVVGIPLPFMSHGGSSMMTNMICLGTLMMINRWNRRSGRRSLA